MRLTLVRALTVALVALGGAGAMAFPKLIVAEAVPEPTSPSFAAPAPTRVPVIRVVPPTPGSTRPAPPVASRRAAPGPSAVTAPPPAAARASVVSPARKPGSTPLASVPVRPAPAASPPLAATPPPAPAPAPSPAPQPAPTPQLAVRMLALASTPHVDVPTTRPQKAKKPKHDKKDKRADREDHVDGHSDVETPDAVSLVAAPVAAEDEDGADDGDDRGKGHDQDGDKEKGKNK